MPTDGDVAGGLGDDDAFHFNLVEGEIPPQEFDVVAEKIDRMEKTRVVIL